MTDKPRTLKITHPPLYIPPPLLARDVIASYVDGVGWTGVGAKSRTRRGTRR